MQVTQWILELVDRITSPLHAATDAAEEATRVIDDTEEVVERLGAVSYTHLTLPTTPYV